MNMIISPTISLASLPHDIVRKIIKMRTTQTMDNMRIISKNWNFLVQEYFQRLPKLRKLDLSLDCGELCVYLFYSEKDRSHFEKLSIRGTTDLCESCPEPCILTRFDLNSNQLFGIVSWISNNVNCIDWMILDGFDMEKLKILNKSMRSLNIDFISITENCSLNKRDTLKRMLSKHNSFAFGFWFNKNFKTTRWGNYIRKISSELAVVHLYLNHDGELPNIFKNYWERFAKNLTRTGKKEKAVIHQRNGRRSPYYHQPWIEFMDTFREFF